MPARLGIAVLVLIASMFGANHVAARFAMDHGASVAGAVGTRSACTALALLALLRLSGTAVSFTPRVLVIGGLVAIQSFCLYSAIARMPVALALLVFQSFPMLYVLLSWAMGKERPPLKALAAVPVALLGLALALDVTGKAGDFAGRWAEIGSGVSWALAASTAFTLVMYLNAHWLGKIDGRVRTFYMMAITAVLTFGGGGAAGAIAFPASAGGWAALAALTLLYGTAITSLFVILPRLSGGAVSTVALNFEPIAALIFAWVLLGQAITPIQVLGAFLVVGAIAWLSLAKR